MNIGFLRQVKNQLIIPFWLVIAGYFRGSYNAMEQKIAVGDLVKHKVANFKMRVVGFEVARNSSAGNNHPRPICRYWLSTLRNFTLQVFDNNELEKVVQ